MAPDADHDAAVQATSWSASAPRATPPPRSPAGRRSGVRAVEPAAGRRAYVAAFEGPAFLCLDGATCAPEADERRARETASASLLWEHVEALVDPDALRDLAPAIGRLLALGGDPPEVDRPARDRRRAGARAGGVAGATRCGPSPRCRTWTPGAALQERLVGAYARFMRASRAARRRAGHAARAELVEALRDVEEAAARAGAAERLADRLAAAVPECEEGAEQMLAAAGPAGPRRRAEPPRHRGLVPAGPGHARRGARHRRRGSPPPRPAAAATCCSSTPRPGEYGCLAEWDAASDAEGFAARPATRAALAALEARLGKPPRVRLYAMEEDRAPLVLYSPRWSRRTLVVMEGDQTGQELLEEALRVLDPAVTGFPIRDRAPRPVAREPPPHAQPGRVRGGRGRRCATASA